MRGTEYVTGRLDPKREEAKGSWRKLHNKDNISLYT